MPVDDFGENVSDVGYRIDVIKFARPDERHNLARRAENAVAFYNKRGTCEQYIKEGEGAINWTRLSCRSFAANAVRLQLHALAYNIGNFSRTLATPQPIKGWTLTTLKEKQIKIGARCREPRPLRRFPDGGGRYSEGLVRADSP